MCIIMLANLNNPTAYDILSTDEPLYSLIAYPNEVHSIPILSGDVMVQEVDYKLLCAQGDIMEQGSLAFDNSINTIRMSRLWENGKILRIINLGANRVTIVTRFTRSAECRCTVLDISSVADLMNANVSTIIPAPQQVAAFEEISIEIDGMVADTTYTVTCAQAESVDFSLRLYTPYSLVTEKDNIIVSALKVRRINVDSVTLSIAFLAQTSRDVYYLVKTSLVTQSRQQIRYFHHKRFFLILMLLVCTHHNRLQLEHLVELNLTSPSVV